MSRLRRPTKHDDLLNFQLKRLFKLGGAPAVQLCEGHYGIARNEWRMLAALAEGGPTSPSELYARVGGDPARGSRVVASLVEKRLVARKPDETDKRRARVSVTPAGRALYDELLPQLLELNARLMSVLSESEAKLLEQFLRRLTDNARHILAEGTGVDARADRRHGGSRRVWDNRTKTGPLAGR